MRTSKHWLVAVGMLALSVIACNYLEIPSLVDLPIPDVDGEVATATVAAQDPAATEVEAEESAAEASSPRAPTNSFIVSSCSIDALPVDTQPPSIPVERQTLPFQEADTSIVFGDTLLIREQGFALLNSLPGYITGTSDDGLDWVEYSFANAPDPAELSIIDRPTYGFKYRINPFPMPGLGGKVELLDDRQTGAQYVCLAADSNDEVIIRPHPFNEANGYDRPRLVGVAGETIVLLVDQVPAQENIFFDKDGVRIELVLTSEEPMFIESTTGDQVVPVPQGDDVIWMNAETGEEIAIISNEEFQSRMVQGADTRDATTLPPIQSLAWSADRGASWQLAELPGQEYVEYRTYVRTAAVREDGTVLVMLETSLRGQLFDPDELDGNLSEEELEEAYQSRMLERAASGNRNYFARTELPTYP